MRVRNESAKAKQGFTRWRRFKCRERWRAAEWMSGDNRKAATTAPDSETLSTSWRNEGTNKISATPVALIFSRWGFLIARDKQLIATENFASKVRNSTNQRSCENSDESAVAEWTTQAE